MLTPFRRMLAPSLVTSRTQQECTPGMPEANIVAPRLIIVRSFARRSNRSSSGETVGSVVDTMTTLGLGANEATGRNMIDRRLLDSGPGFRLISGGKILSRQCDSATKLAS
jgi:hypothetical protein